MDLSAPICNMALSHLGQDVEIADVENENTPQARAMRRFYATALKQTLRDFNWPFATKTVALELVEENPTSEWAYAYHYPSDCVQFRRILSGIRNDNAQSEVPFRVAYGSASAVIYTDAKEAEGEYTVLVDDPSRFPDDFTQALSMRLAAYVAPRIGGPQAIKLREAILALYFHELGGSRANAMNEEQAEEEPEAESIRGRD